VVGVKIVRGNQGVLRGLAAAMKLWELDVDVGSSEVHGGGGSKSTNTNNTDSTRLHHSCEETGWALATETRRSVSDNIPYLTIPYLTILYHTIPYHTLPYHTLPYLTIPYLTIPYHIIPYLPAALYLREMILSPSLPPLLWHLVMGMMSPATEFLLVFSSHERSLASWFLTSYAVGEIFDEDE
jgi:hypothetical protein